MVGFSVKVHCVVSELVQMILLPLKKANTYFKMLHIKSLFNYQVIKIHPFIYSFHISCIVNVQSDNQKFVMNYKNHLSKVEQANENV